MVWYVLLAVAEVKYPLIDAPAGIVTVPVKVGLARGAYVELADEVVRYPLMEAPAGIVTVPVNVGEAKVANPAAVM